MSTKNKALPIIDVQSTSNATPPSTRRVRFNPYTGGIITNGNDKPTFGKYTMELRSSTQYESKEVTFRKVKDNKGKWTYLKVQIPIPAIKLLVRNPNYDMVQSIVFLALTEEALAGVDNGGNYEDSQRRARPSDRYISFSPSSKSPVIKNTITMDVKPQIVQLFQKYSIYEFLEIICGKSYEEVTDNNQLISALYENLRNVPIYGEAGFANDSDSVTDGYFIRNKLITRFSFDRSYLDNPVLKGITLKATAKTLDVRITCSNLRTVTLNIYSSPTGTFNYSQDAPIKTLKLDVAGDVNPVFQLDLNTLKPADFNTLADFRTVAALDSIINSRKYFAVKITSVVVSAGIEKKEKEFSQFFGLAADNKDTTKQVSLTYNVPQPVLATFIPAVNFPKPPYFVNLVNNSRKFFFCIEVAASGPFDPSVPEGISGFLFKYINNAGTASNTLRYYSLDHPNVKQELAGFIEPGKSTVKYYYSITDYFKRPAAAENTFKLDVPHASAVHVYLVDKYYYTSNDPLVLPNVKQYDLVNYFTQEGNRFFNFDSLNQLTFNGDFVKTIQRLNLSFYIEYTPALATQIAPPTTAVWKKYTDSYTFAIDHVHGNMLDYTAVSPRVYKLGTPTALTVINLSALFMPIKKGLGQGLWIRFRLIENYPTTKVLPYSGTMLGQLRQLV